MSAYYPPPEDAVNGFCLNRALIGDAYTLLTMTFRTVARLARTLLAAMLCVAVASFALPAGQQKAEAHGFSAAAADHDHRNHSHDDDDTGDPDHAERHAADHSHDTPAAPARIDYASKATSEMRSRLLVASVLTGNPSPGDRPPRSVA
jgi:hypothetical protein